jgi:hypothetical protein
LKKKIRKINVHLTFPPPLPFPFPQVFDWGSGCGHKLSWFAQFFGIRGTGIDIDSSSVEYANRFMSAELFCQMDGRYLEWIPDGYLDHVFKIIIGVIDN